MERETFSEKHLDELASVDIRTVDPESLVDIRDITIDPKLTKEEKTTEFIRQIGNPFCFRHGKYVVKVSYTDTDVTLEERILSYIRFKCQ